MKAWSGILGAFLLFSGGFVFPRTVNGQAAYVRWGNTSTTPVFTNDCSGMIGPINGLRAYRFGLYLGPIGSSAGALTFSGLLATNTVNGLFGTPNPSRLPPLAVSGVPLSFQVRGWPLAAGATFEEALSSPSPVPVGTSAVGYFTPSPDSFNAPMLFGRGPGQVGGFELRGLCPEVSNQRLAPDGPLAFTRFTRANTYTWTNVVASNATYRFSTAGALAGPYANWTTVTAATSEVTFASPYNGTFYKVEWIDAPPPQPMGGWDYQVFDSAGNVMVAGILNFTSNIPTHVNYTVSRLQTGGIANLHPSGPATAHAISSGSSNAVEIAFSSEFRLRGQMVGRYFAGDWVATDPIIEPVPGEPIARTYTGRFLAMRRF
jgi:hypothetical protein